MVPPATPSDINVGPSGRPTDICVRSWARSSRATSSARLTTRCSSATASPRAALRRAARRALRAASHAELGQRQMEADKAFLHAGHHVHRLRRQSGHRAHLSVRSAAAHHHGGRVAHARARPDAAADGHQPVPEGRLSRRTDPRRRRRAARPGPELPALPPRDARRARAPRHLRVGGRHRSRPARGRPVRRARGQPARAERRVVHAREPRGHQARAAGPVRPLSRQPDRALRSGAARDAARAGAAGRRRIRRSSC